MKAVAVLILALCANTAAAVTVRANGTPVSRTVELMKMLAGKVEKDGKAEEDLYETFVCWAKSIVSQKTQSNEAAKNVISERSTYIADLAAGRIELTDERVTLEKQIKSLTDELESLKSTREKENSDFEDAKAEMEMAVKALGDAIDVLKVSTEGSETGVFVQESEGYNQRAASAASLHRAADLAEKVLSKGDAFFLRRLLTGDVATETPKPDWKKLNRKATFKMSYKKRSGKIQDTLAKLLQEFEGNLKDATDAESKAIATFTTLMTSKTAELDSAQEARENMDGENGAKAMGRTEAKDELDRLTAEVEADTKYIKSVEDQLAEKKEEWKDRQVLRAGELAAISKAIEILSNDDARDLMKKSFASHDASFMQVAMSSMVQQTRSRAVAALKNAAAQTSDARLSTIAARLAATGHMDEVIEAINKMLKTLEAEEESDREKKETCEADRAKDTKDAQVFSRTYDENHDEMVRLTGENADLTQQVEEKTAAIKAIIEELAQAKKIREEENAEYLTCKADDEEASKTVLKAKGVLENFYKENDLVFMQAKKAPFTSTAGDAPPPPPPTWEAPYGGKTGESQGIVAILQMVGDDIKKDAAKTKTEMDETLASSTKEKGNLEDENKELSSEMKELEKTQGDKEMSVVENKGDRNTQKQGLEGTMKVLADKDSFCVFFTVNYPLRLKNRQIEMDGLEKAKAILSGAVFEEPKDPNREIKPGDALVQKQQKNLRQVRKH
mmetsp:Transcript_51368/g.112046  ORF Transcript_51368/g.112046 Transcript_51368/m.112046 type:complete len:732 (+) Transcript_51368:88-2283(+)